MPEAPPETVDMVDLEVVAWSWPRPHGHRMPLGQINELETRRIQGRSERSLTFETEPVEESLTAAEGLLSLV